MANRDDIPTKGNMKDKEEEERMDEKKYFLKVLDDVVSLNSLFTMAVFIGLSFAQPGQIQSLSDNPSCHPDTNTRKRLVAFEIASFSCFVFAGVLAKTVKVFLYTSEKQDAEDRKKKDKPVVDDSRVEPYRKLKSLVGFYLSIYGTMLGCLLLLLAMVEIVQIKLGRLSCYSNFTIGTVSVMVGTIGLSLLIYFAAVTYGLAVSDIKSRQQKNKGAALEGAEEA